jgi:DNA-binding NarL/FixJ family response regulator
MGEPSWRSPGSRGNAVLVMRRWRADRDCLAEHLASAGASPVVEAASPAEARVRVRGIVGEVAVIEMEPNERDSRRLIAELRRGGWRHVLAVTSSADPERLRMAIGAGAHGYVISGRRERAVTASAPGPSLVKKCQLTVRQRQIVNLVAEGRSNREIAEQLRVSKHTVKSHLMRLAERLGTGDRTQMVLIALRAQAID